MPASPPIDLTKSRSLGPSVWSREYKLDPQCDFHFLLPRALSRSGSRREHLPDVIVSGWIVSKYCDWYTEMEEPKILQLC